MDPQQEESRQGDGFFRDLLERAEASERCLRLTRANDEDTSQAGSDAVRLEGKVHPSALLDTGASTGDPFFVFEKTGTACRSSYLGDCGVVITLWPADEVEKGHILMPSSALPGGKALNSVAAIPLRSLLVLVKSTDCGFSHQVAMW